ncbi:MAG: carbon dioxide transporter, partial [Merismopedia sp. SIO2A8]|nr:carbon dioxide transporter [Merismopedia sp. SIO2A8]
MSVETIQPSTHSLAPFIHTLESGYALLPHSEQNVMEVVGILKSYGVVLDAYSINLNYIADHQSLIFFQCFSSLSRDISPLKYLNHGKKIR